MDEPVKVTVDCTLAELEEYGLDPAELAVEWGEVAGFEIELEFEPGEEGS
jgi:hypothetical protein